MAHFYYSYFRGDVTIGIETNICSVVFHFTQVQILQLKARAWVTEPRYTSFWLVNNYIY